MKTLCYLCNDLICDGPTFNGHVSHGLCQPCAIAEFTDMLSGMSDAHLDAEHHLTMKAWREATADLATSAGEEAADARRRCDACRAEAEAIMNEARRRAHAALALP